MDKGDPGQGTREATAGVSNVLTSPVSSSTVLKFENWLYIYIYILAGEMAQQGKALANQPDDLSSILGPTW